MNQKLINEARLTRSRELKKLRTDVKMNIKTLSEMSGLHFTTIYRIESGLAWNIDSEIVYKHTIESFMIQMGHQTAGCLPV